MIRLLALDMDGTCLNGRSRMTEETIRTIRKAADAGIIIVPTSGRPLTCLPYRMTQEKGLYRYTTTSNGAQVVDLEEKKTLFRMLMKRERVVQFLRECEGLNVVRMTHDTASLCDGRDHWMEVARAYCLWQRCGWHPQSQ